MSQSILSPKAYQLILDWEVGGGQAYYDKFLARPDWPGGASGVTVGVGFDCGYYFAVEIRSTWGGYGLDSKILDGLASAAGITGTRAQSVTRELKWIVIPWSAAETVYDTTTLPKFYRLASVVFDGLDNLCPDAAGALVSLVFNRGTSLAGPRRREMRTIASLVPKKDYAGIAAQLRSMKRIWAGTSIQSLCQRREEEAVLVESCS